MGYKRAEEILPEKMIELIQEYVQGESIYIPRKKEQRQEWGKGTAIRQELNCRNLKIFEDYRKGCTVLELSKKYFLSEKSIQRIIRKLRS